MSAVNNGVNWLRFYDRQPQAGLRLFCFPYAGAGPSVFKDWSALLLPGVELIGVNYPGRESRVREALVNDLNVLVNALAVAILPHLDKPFAFFGHSMGSYVCYELSRILEQRHRLRPELVFISAAGAPHLPEPNPIHALPASEFLKALLRLNGFPPEVLGSPELVHRALPILRADFTACETYHYKIESPAAFPLTVYGGTDDRRVGAERLEAWRQHAGVSFSMNWFDGDHFYLRPRLQRVLGSVNSELAGLRP